ncbi:D-alanyl-D-alanine carboxypeptidase family protein [Desulfurella sp.]|uniref:D-alanyl-D-alanine carboxypeptidase family protein n=1 Tax=Desulfurella sp. TaxID=1962857 RepID=UPI003D0A792C
MITKKRKLRIGWLLVLVICIALIYSAYKMLNLSTKNKVTLTIPVTYKVAGKLKINWPYNSEGNILIYHYGILSKTSNQQPMPIASVTKIMTAYLVLKDHPLYIGQNGPIINISSNDVRIYKKDKANQQSVLKIAKGEKLSEKELLEGLLLPSGNDCATILAKWDSGSVKSFVAKMNKMAKLIGMNHTHYADPAGVKLDTQSTSSDQIKLAKKAMEIPVFRYLVSKAQAVLPVAGIVYNVNYDLGKDNIVGIKTGSMPQSGGDFVFAAKKMVGFQRILIIGDLLGEYGKQPLMDALNSSIKIINQARKNLELKKIFSKNQIIGYMYYDWSKPIGLKLKKSFYAILWPGEKLKIHYKTLKSKLPFAKGQVVGYLDITNKSFKKQIPVFVNSLVQKPTLEQRLNNVFRI